MSRDRRYSYNVNRANTRRTTQNYRSNYSAGNSMRASNRRYSTGYGMNGRADSMRPQEYIQGNAVRQLEAIPQEREEPRRQKKERRDNQAQIKTFVIGRGSFIFLVAVIAMIALAAYSIISARSQVNDVRTEISLLKAENEVAREKINDKKNSINDSIDLAQIYDVAVNEYKMVDASNGKVFKYDNSKSEIVQQYDEVK